MQPISHSQRDSSLQVFVIWFHCQVTDLPQPRSVIMISEKGGEISFCYTRRDQPFADDIYREDEGLMYMYVCMQARSHSYLHHHASSLQWMVMMAVCCHYRRLSGTCSFFLDVCVCVCVCARSEARSMYVHIVTKCDWSRCVRRHFEECIETSARRREDSRFILFCSVLFGLSIVKRMAR